MEIFGITITNYAGVAFIGLMTIACGVAAIVDWRLGMVPKAPKLHGIFVGDRYIKF